MEPKRKIYEELLFLALATGQAQDENRIKIYVEDLSEFKIESVILAIRAIRKTTKFFPSLGEIIEKIQSPDGPTDEMAVMISNQIIEAFSMFGQQNSGEARAFLGPDKWGIVERSGGWNNICLTPYSELGTLRAQIREVAKAYLNRSKRESKGGELRINSNPIQIGNSELKKLSFGEFDAE